MTAAQLFHFHLDRLKTPIGTAVLVSDDEGYLRALDWSGHEARMHRLLTRHYGEFVLTDGASPDGITRPLEAYFSGDLAQLSAVKWRTNGTPFQQKVWKKLQTIPAGQTSSYGLIAAGLKIPNAARAVGLANGANPVSVVVPCHRLIGADGSLTGYAGGLSRKRWLLAHEGAAFRS